MYLLATGYGQSQHIYSEKLKEIDMEVSGVKTDEDLKRFEQSIHDEGKQLAQSILQDMKKTGTLSILKDFKP